MKILIAGNFVSLSKRKGKKKKAKTHRQEFLSSLMGKVSGDAGESLATAFVNGEVDKFEEKWGKVSSDLMQKCKERSPDNAFTGKKSIKGEL